MRLKYCVRAINIEAKADVVSSILSRDKEAHFDMRNSLGNETEIFWVETRMGDLELRLLDGVDTAFLSLSCLEQ